MLERGLTSQRIHQDLQSEHGFAAKYPSVRRYVARLSESTDPPFRRLECEPGTEMQVDFGTGARCKNHEDKLVKTYVFRVVLSHSRKGYSEAVTQMTVERFIQVLENAFFAIQIMAGRPLSYLPHFAKNPPGCRLHSSRLMVSPLLSKFDGKGSAVTNVENS